jgi:hypothetical protein
MPRFEPQYLTEHDGTRLREAQHALVNARGHYLGEAASFAGTTAAPSTSAEKKAILRQNRARAQREIEKRMPGAVTVNADGSLHLVNPLTPMNRAMADLLRPAHGVIDSSPLSAADKTKLKTQPVTFFVDLFDPVLDGVRDVLVEVMQREGFVYDLSTPPFMFTLGNPAFKNVNIRLYQPGDDLFDDESRGIILRVRMLLAYFVLFFRKPAELQFLLIKKGLEALFGKDDTQLVPVGQGGDGSSFDKPRIVMSMPTVWRGGSRKEIPAGPYLIRRYTASPPGLPTRRDLDDVTKLVWEIPQDNRKNQTRSFVQLTQAAWDQWRRPRAGLINARLDEGRPINGLGSLGISPVAAAAKGTAVKVAVDTGTAAGGGQAAVAAIWTWLGNNIVGIIGAVGGAIAGIIVAVNQPAVAAEEAREAEAKAREEEAKTRGAGEGSLQSQSASGGVSPLLIGGAVLAALFILRKGSKA